MEKIKPVIEWGCDTENVRAMILTGSLASKNKKDTLSDYDIAVFGYDFDFIKRDDWIKSFSDYWVCVRDSFDFLKHEIPTRLVIFDEALKIDFSFHPVKLLKKLSEELSDEYNIGYKILLDKDNITKNFPKASCTGFILEKPTPEEFKNNIEEFWFEVYHVEKYLIRKDLWTAKLRDLAVKEKLRQMLEWNHGAQQSWTFSPGSLGKEMNTWLDKNLRDELHNCWGSFDKADSARALENTIKLYRKVCNETAAALNYNYNYELDKNISTLIKKLNFENHISF